MAVIKRGILGGFQNKIGNVVGSSWKGIATMRALPISVANPRTAAQQTQRSSFQRASYYGSFILPTIIKPLWDRFAQRQSGFNAWVSTNIPFMGGLGSPDFTSWIMSKGSLAGTSLVTVTANATTNSVTVTWNTAVVGDGLATDRVYITVISESDDRIVGFADIAARSAGTFTSVVPVDIIAGTPVHAWVSFKSEDGTKVSNSVIDSVTP